MQSIFVNEWNGHPYDIILCLHESLLIGVIARYFVCLQWLCCTTGGSSFSDTIASSKN